MQDLIINEKKMPVIAFNYETMKEWIDTECNKYKDLVVTEETLKGCEGTHKELSSLKTKLDKFRKEVKKEVKKPIDEFEVKVKALIGLIETTQEPIKKGIDTFEERRKQSVRDSILSKLNHSKEELSEKYLSTFIIDERWLNRTAKKKDIDEGIQSQISLLKQLQTKEQTDILTLKQIIISENEKISSKIKEEEYVSRLDESNILILIEEVCSLSKKLQESERIAKEEVKKETQEEQSAPITTPKPCDTKKEDLITVSISVSSSRVKLDMLKDFMGKNNINWSQN